MNLKKLQFKNIYFTPSLRFVAFLTFLIGVASFSFWTNEEKIDQAIYVRIPPAIDFSTLSDEEIIQYRADYFMSNTEVIDRNIPFYNYYCNTLQVWINAEGRIFFSGVEFGNINNTTELVNELEQVFQNRTYHRMLAENSGEIDKKVVLVTTHSLKYGEIIKVIDAIKASGANQIVLGVNELSKDYKIGTN